MNMGCYRCPRKGNARKYSHTYRLRVKVGEKTEVKDFKGTIWKAKGFKNIGLMGLNTSLDRYVWLCFKCRKKICKVCSVGLSNKWLCRCNGQHGSFHPKHPEYCKQCWDDKYKNDDRKRIIKRHSKNP